MVKVPDSNPDCPIYKKIDEEILYLLKNIEWYNEKLLEVFWELNIGDKDAGNT